MWHLNAGVGKCGESAISSFLIFCSPHLNYVVLPRQKQYHIVFLLNVRHTYFYKMTLFSIGQIKLRLYYYFLYLPSPLTSPYPPYLCMIYCGLLLVKHTMSICYDLFLVITCAILAVLVCKTKHCVKC